MLISKNFDRDFPIFWAGVSTMGVLWQGQAGRGGGEESPAARPLPRLPRGPKHSMHSMPAHLVSSVSSLWVVGLGNGAKWPPARAWGVGPICECKAVQNEGLLSRFMQLHACCPMQANQTAAQRPPPAQPMRRAQDEQHAKGSKAKCQSMVLKTHRVHLEQS